MIPIVLLCLRELAFILCLQTWRAECMSAAPCSPGPSVCLCSVYSGHQSILIPPSELETNPALWLLAVSQYKVRDTFCSYSVMELCTKGLGSQTESLKVSSLSPGFQGNTCQHPREARCQRAWGGFAGAKMIVHKNRGVIRCHRKLPRLISCENLSLEDDFPLPPRVIGQGVWH